MGTKSSSSPFEMVKWSLHILGIWNESMTIKHIHKMIFVLVYVIFNTTCFLGFYSEIGNGNLEVVCSKAAMLTVGGYASTVLLVHNKEEYQTWLTGMFENEQFMTNHPNRKLRALYRHTIQNIWPRHLFSMNQWALSTAVVIFAVLMVFFINDKLKHINECSDAQDCNMVLMGYYYFPWNVNEHYWLANLEDVAFGGLCGVFAITRDMYFASYICYLICRLRLLSYVIRNLYEFVGDELRLSQKTEKIDILLGDCVREHQDIIREFMILKRISSTMFLIMLLVHAPAVANITLTIFKGDSTSTFALFVYCAAFYGCTHLYLILSLSEQLSSECLHLAKSIHFFKWYEMSIKHQKVLMFMLMRAQKPLTLTCGAMFPANLATFTKTMRAIYTILNAFMNLS